MNPAITTPISEPALPHGSVHLPGEPEYGDATSLFNSMIERRPRLVARCNSAEDAAAALAFARREGLPFTVRAGGHSVAGLSLCEDGVVADLRGIDYVEVDPERRTARVGGGANWGQVDRATGAHGLATTGGRVSTTGVAGLTLGGGSGWLERKHGLASDNLRGAEMITAEGRRVRADEAENPELFWALRGGGGNFGIVTEFEFALHPLPDQVLAGLVVHPGERTAELMALWRDVMRDAPEELSLALFSLTAPDEPEFPEHLQGTNVVAIAGMYAGPVAEAEEAMRAVREFGDGVDMFEPMSYADFQCALDDPPGYRNWWTADNVHELPDDAIERLAARCAAKPAGPAQLFCVAWGGQVARPGPLAGPLSGRDTRYVIHPLVLWEDEADDEEMIAWGRGFHDDLAELADDGTYLNFVGADEAQTRAVASYGVESYERLARIKAAWDPEDVFRGSGHVKPAERAGVIPGSGNGTDGGRLTAAVGLSAAGDTLALIPLAALISEVTGSGFAVGRLFAALWAPMVVLAPVAGWLADRYETTRLLTVVSLLQAAAASAFVFATGSVAAIIAIAVLVGSGHAVAQAAEFSLAPAIENGERLKRLNGRVEAARYLGMTAGPAAGGALAAAGGITIALLGNVATFLFVAAVAASLAVRREPAGGGSGGPSARDGFAYLFAPSLRLLMVVASVSLFLMTAVWTAEPFFAREVLGGGDLAYGLLMSAWTLGMAVGAIGLAARVPAAAMATAALALIAVQGAGLLAPTLWLSIPFAVALYVVGGLAHGTKNTLIRTLIHERVPSAAHGRAAAAYNALRNGAELLALAVGGAMVAGLGARATVSLSGALPMAVALAALCLVAVGARSRSRPLEPGTVAEPSLR